MHTFCCLLISLGFSSMDDPIPDEVEAVAGGGGERTGIFTTCIINR